MADEVYLTRAGYKKLYSELEQLKVERIKISRAIEEARLQGDISENAEYDAAKMLRPTTLPGWRSWK